MIDNILYSQENALGLPKPFISNFTNSFIDNSHLFIILLLIGVTGLTAVIISEYILNMGRIKIEMGRINEIKHEKQVHKNLEMQIIHPDKENIKPAKDGIKQDNIIIGEHNITKLEDSEDISILLNVTKNQFKKCSVESNRQYFLLNYFIRVYQVTMTKLILTCVLVITNYDLPNSKQYEVILSYLVLFFWVLGMPVGLFVYLRTKQSFLMSPKFVIKYGAFYLNFRGIYKDVHALLIQFKFALLPLICVVFWRFPQIQLILLFLTYFFNVLYVTSYTPFCKVTKVFFEAMSEGILMGLCVLLLLSSYLTVVKVSIYTRYCAFAMICILLFLRMLRIIIDTIIRIKNLILIKQPDVIGDKNPYKPKNKNDDYSAQTKDGKHIEEIKFEEGKLNKLGFSMANFSKDNKNESQTKDLSFTMNGKDNSIFETKCLNIRSNNNISVDYNNSAISQRRLLSSNYLESKEINSKNFEDDNNKNKVDTHVNMSRKNLIREKTKNKKDIIKKDAAIKKVDINLSFNDEVSNNIKNDLESHNVLGSNIYIDKELESNHNSDPKVKWEKYLDNLRQSEETLNKTNQSKIILEQLSVSNNSQSTVNKNHKCNNLSILSDKLNIEQNSLSNKSSNSKKKKQFTKLNHLKNKNYNTNHMDNTSLNRSNYDNSINKLSINHSDLHIIKEEPTHLKRKTIFTFKDPESESSFESI